ncbi:uncharacterized protein LOC126900111 [Daktulosphaira vitifoliae]|uniref:uncharacterized protein LOC126900111 n=1 Tax=Daktulosphaira vitifoliae TaxID=58002 RepID=UPI0021AA7E26|nr:uncharacterized protein LOC126900111 [Daktulosphaira vitifoliae]
MGQLPSTRVNPERAFAVTGVDFCGPIMVRSGFGRNTKKEKAYVALFVCFTSKAIHLELVSGLSSEKFVAALRRFISRRGICREIHIDNATNFKGAKRELQDLFLASQRSRSPYDEMAEIGVQWKFIPPRAPNFGGLWEAAVKSTKYHLKRVIGLTTLMFEEMTTLLTQIEACLNSRPITELSNDPNDYNALTPAHFLIGESLLLPPEPSISQTCPTRRSTNIYNS